jgi:hypothetical protein
MLIKSEAKLPKKRDMNGLALTGSRSRVKEKLEGYESCQRQ